MTCMRRALLASVVTVIPATMLVLTVGCSPGMEALRRPPAETAVTTSGTWSSMIYLTRTDSGVIAVDLGWFGRDDVLDDALRSLGASGTDVKAVFLTHSHRDHVAAWERLRGATFYLSAPESSLFVGASSHSGPLTRFVESVRRTKLPAPGELRIRTFSRDTTIVFGRDTIRAYSVPGHTAGSGAYLVRDRLFVGDAVNMLPVVGFRKARWLYSDDVARSTASVAALWHRLPPDPGRIVCTAHGKCTRDTPEFREAALH